jgi:pimeloyl-ACP methyl ester carboxylesterase
LSFLTLPVTKIYGSNDGIATPERTLQNKKLLPAHTRWVEIQGGNHSQFGHYGHQLFDGHASISRIEQQAATRQALLQVLEDAATAEQSSAPESTVNSASSTKSSPPNR